VPLPQELRHPFTADLRRDPSALLARWLAHLVQYAGLARGGADGQREPALAMCTCAPLVSRVVVAGGASPDHAQRNFAPDPSGSNGPKMQQGCRSPRRANAQNVGLDSSLDSSPRIGMSVPIALNSMGCCPLRLCRHRLGCAIRLYQPTRKTSFSGPVVQRMPIAPSLIQQPSEQADHFGHSGFGHADQTRPAGAARRPRTESR
jgi:hypothetical protein